MKKTIILLYFCLCILPSLSSAEGTVSGGAEWQLTFDVVKSKVEGFLEDNNKLSAEQASLRAQLDKLDRSIDAQGRKNDESKAFLKERGGKTDQQILVEELSAKLKAKNLKLAEAQKEADALRAEAAQLHRKIELKKLKISDWELRQNMAAAVKPPVEDLSSGDKELDGLRKELEAHKGKEAELEGQINSANDLRTESVAKEEAAAAEIRELEKKLEDLEGQRSELSRKMPKGDPNASKRSRYLAMAERKSKLEGKIRASEEHIDSLKDAASMGAWGLQRRQMVHDIVVADAKNVQMRHKIIGLREDIALLKDKIVILEKQVGSQMKKK